MSPPTQNEMVSGLRLADSLAALSIVADMGFGLPPQEAMRSSLVAAAIGRKLGLPERDVHDAFYTALLMHIGCMSFSHETAALFGNEVTLTPAVAMTKLGNPQDYVETLVPEATRGLEPANTRPACGRDLQSRPDIRTAV
jgi:hypothetical protein